METSNAINLFMLKISKGEDNGMTVRLSSIYIKNPPLVQGIKSLTFRFRKLFSGERIDGSEYNKKPRFNVRRGLLTKLKKHRITQHQLSILPKTAEDDIICKINNAAITQILHTN